MEVISIHALREEGDVPCDGVCQTIEDFYPRPPRGGRLFSSLFSKYQHMISIHALREEGDQQFRSTGPGVGNFYPRPPRGGRPLQRARVGKTVRFLSTPSARRATHEKRRIRHSCRPISIHALREEGDVTCVFGVDIPGHFYPRPPRGGRPCATGDTRQRTCYFYPRPPRGGRLRLIPPPLHAITYFYPRPPRGGRLMTQT